MATQNLILSSSYNGVFGALFVQIEAAQNTISPSPLTRADTIPVFAQTLQMDLQFAMEQPALEDPYGTAYLGQVTSAKCIWSFEAPLYGAGTTGTSPNLLVDTPRWIAQVLATCFKTTLSAAGTNPTLTLTPTLESNFANDSFSMTGFFGLRGAPAGGNKLAATLKGCRVSKVTFTLKADGLSRVKIEGSGVYDSDWTNSTEDLSGNNWDVTAQEFIRGMGQEVKLQVNGAGDDYILNATQTEIAVDFGAEHIVSDGALTQLGTAAVGLTKRDVSISFDPIWTSPATWDIFSIARAGGFFTISSAYAYPSAYSSTGKEGRGFKIDLPKVQFANTTPERASFVRQKLDGMALKNSESDEPLTLTIGSS
jgi:hypothetical protein